MNATDQRKVINAGFTIIRRDEIALKIKYKGTGSHEWKTLEKGFATKASLQRKMDELLKVSTIIED